MLERATRRALTIAVAAALAAGAAACGGDDEETTTPATTTPTGATGPTGEGGQGGEGEGGQGAGGGDEPGASAQREGAGTGLEENLSGSDVDGTDTAEGGESTTGDTAP